MSNIISRRRFIEVGTGVATSLLLTQNKRKNIDQQPNIVLVVADDLGIETLIPYGSRFYDTPNINKLAKEGLLFRHCYSTPLCTHSRVELMTGKYSHRNYVTFAHLPKGETTFAHLLKRAGYRTCIVGKWQLWASNGQLPSEAGFDEYALSPAPAAKSGIKVGKGYYWFPKVNRNDVWQPTTSTDYGPNIHLDYLIDFIERHRNQPFFAYYAQHLPHAPYDATPLSSDVGVRRNPAVFPEMVAYLDHQIGRILQKLNELLIRDNTIVIFTSDNGTPGVIESPFQGRTVRGGKGLLNDRGTQVPLIVSWEGKIPVGIELDGRT